MNTEHVIDKNFPGVKELLAKTFPSYRGRKLKLYIQENISFDDINWDGGSRTEYFLVNTDTQEVQKVANHKAPWTQYAYDAAQPRAIPKNCIIVSQGCFCGKMGGINFTVSSQTALAQAGESIANILVTGPQRIALT